MKGRRSFSSRIGRRPISSSFGWSNWRLPSFFGLSPVVELAEYRFQVSLDDSVDLAVTLALPFPCAFFHSAMIPNGAIVYRIRGSRRMGSCGESCSLEEQQTRNNQ